jgi:hypothetical protein
MRKRLQFETRELKLSDIKFTEGVFISDRKVQRFAAQFKGTLRVSTESHEEWTENVRFFASLIAAPTSRAVRRAPPGCHAQDGRRAAGSRRVDPLRLDEPGVAAHSSWLAKNGVS